MLMGIHLVVRIGSVILRAFQALGGKEEYRAHR